MSQNPETRIQQKCLLTVGKRLDVLAWRQQVGKYRRLDSDAVVSIGDVGMADVGMVVSVEITPEMVGKRVGVYVGVEFKTATGRQRPEQKDWQRVIESRDAVYRIVRSESEMIALVDDVKSGRAFREQAW